MEDVVTTRFSGASALVTGGKGFIGSHLCRALRGEGAAVVALGRRDFPPSESSLATAQYVFHLASRVDRSLMLVDECVQANFLTTVALLSACKDRPLKRFVLVSTTDVYGGAQAPFVESTRPEPRTPYGASKLAAEEFALLYARSFGVAVTVVRLAMVVGPGQPSDRMLPQLVSALRRGDRLAMGDRRQARDVLYVDDAVDGIVRAALSDTVGEVINLGSPEAVSLGEIVDEIRGRIGGPEPNYGARTTPGGVEAYATNVDKARRLLGWAPRLNWKAALHKVMDEDGKR